MSHLYIVLATIPLVLNKDFALHKPEPLSDSSSLNNKMSTMRIDVDLSLDRAVVQRGEWAEQREREQEEFTRQMEQAQQQREELERVQRLREEEEQRRREELEQQRRREELAEQRRREEEEQQRREELEQQRRREELAEQRRREELAEQRRREELEQQRRREELELEERRRNEEEQQRLADSNIFRTGVATNGIHPPEEIHNDIEVSPPPSVLNSPPSSNFASYQQPINGQPTKKLDSFYEFEQGLAPPLPWDVPRNLNEELQEVLSPSSNTNQVAASGPSPPPEEPAPVPAPRQRSATNSPAMNAALVNKQPVAPPKPVYYQPPPVASDKPVGAVPVISAGNIYAPIPTIMPTVTVPLAPSNGFTPAPTVNVPLMPSVMSVNQPPPRPTSSWHVPANLPDQTRPPPSGSVRVLPSNSGLNNIRLPPNPPKPKDTPQRLSETYNVSIAAVTEALKIHQSEDKIAAFARQYDLLVANGCAPASVAIACSLLDPTVSIDVALEFIKGYEKLREFGFGEDIVKEALIVNNYQTQEALDYIIRNLR